MRTVWLTQRFWLAWVTLPEAQRVRSAVDAALDSLLVGSVRQPEDVSVRLPAYGIGRPVPGTDLLLCFVPGLDRVTVITLQRRE